MSGNPKYLRPFTDKDGNTVYLDAYDLIEGLAITCPAMQHAAKKVMYTGVRGHKDFLTDIKDIEDSLLRAKQLHKGRSHAQP